MNLVEKHIKHFNKLNGNRVSKARLKDFLKKVKACADPDLVEVEQRLEKAIAQMRGDSVVVEVKKIDWRSLKKRVVVHETEKKAAPVATRIMRDVSPFLDNKKMVIPPRVDLSKLKFREIKLKGQFKKDFVSIKNDRQIMIWGLPGHGKTSYLLKLAKHLAVDLRENVLYACAEEYGRSSFMEKIHRFSIPLKNPKLTLDSWLPADLSKYDVIFLDSVQRFGLTVKGFQNLVSGNPGKCFILVLQTTKDGDFKGGQDWEHEVDVAGEIRNFKYIPRKNRGDDKAKEKAEELHIEDAARELEKKKRVKAMVNKTLKGTEEETQPEAA